MLQNRVIRYFMGVHRFTPILALTGDIGWGVSTSRRWVNILRLMNKLIKMNENRLTKKVQVGKDQEKAQSKKDPHSKNRGGKKPN